MTLNPTHKWFIPGSLAALLLGALWILASRTAPGRAPAEVMTAPQAGFRAPAFSLATLDGENLSLNDFAGRPVLINLWASWCGPCRAEMPAIQRVYDTYQDQGFTVLAVNMTAQDNPAAARAFVEEYGLTFPVLLDTTGEVGRLYENRALPSSFFVRPDGSIAEVIIGGPMAEALLLTRVQNLFGGAP